MSSGAADEVKGDPDGHNKDHKDSYQGFSLGGIYTKMVTPSRKDTTAPKSRNTYSKKNESGGRLRFEASAGAASYQNGDTATPTCDDKSAIGSGFKFTYYPGQNQKGPTAGGETSKDIESHGAGYGSTRNGKNPASDADSDGHWSMSLGYGIHLGLIKRHRTLNNIFHGYHLPLHSVVPHGPSLAEPHQRQWPRIYRELIIVSSAMFMGYGSLVAFQHKLFDAYRLNSHGEHWSSNKELLKHGAVMNYIGNLAFRFLHNVFLACLSSRQRVSLALWAMAVSMFMLGFCVYYPFYTTWVPVVYIAYFLGGGAIGTFETNILSCVTPLGHDSKLWAMLGIPIGFSSMSVGGMFACGAGLPVEWLYYMTAIMCVIGVLLFACFVPSGYPPMTLEEQARLTASGKKAPEEELTGKRNFYSDIKKYQTWFPIVWWPSVARTICMFFLTFFSSFNLYRIPTEAGEGGHDIVPIHAFGSTGYMRVSFYLAVLNFMQLIGDTVSRKLAYILPACNPVWYNIWSVSGGVMCYFCNPILTWFGTLFIFLGNGAIYSNSVRRIDEGLEESNARQLDLIAISMWLLLGDIGSVIGSNTWQFFT